MKRLSVRIAGPAFLFALALGTSYSGNVSAATCAGNCGSQAATDGVVTGAAQWISTTGGLTGVGSLGVGGETNGSTLTTGTFSASVGQILNYNFNYVTSDGSGFPDYAWVQLINIANPSNPIYLLTARTEPSGSIIPGAGLPPIDATLTPPSVPIIPGGPTWSALGSWSGFCWAAGCGYTGWVNSQYTISTDGTYELIFGVINANDTAYDSGLAFNGVTIGGGTIDTGNTPLPAALPLFATGLGGMFLIGRRKKRKAAALAAA
jgi:hypothetical protein